MDLPPLLLLLLLLLLRPATATCQCVCVSSLTILTTSYYYYHYCATTTTCFTTNNGSSQPLVYFHLHPSATRLPPLALSLLLIYSYHRYDRAAPCLFDTSPLRFLSLSLSNCATKPLKAHSVSSPPCKSTLYDLESRIHDNRQFVTKLHACAPRQVRRL